MGTENHQSFYLIQHIPKTAGTTLRHIVDQQFGPKNVLTYYNQPSIQLLENIEAHLTIFPNYQAIIGHFKFGVHQKLSSASTYITFLRHPVARTISQYKEWTVNSPERLCGEDGKIQTLAESVDKNPDYYRDYQTSFLIGEATADMPAASISDIALQNLADYYDGIGLVEYFDQSM